MKFNIKTSLLALLGLIVMSCSNDDMHNNETTLQGEGTLAVEFNNVFGNKKLAINTQEYDKQNGKVVVERLSYIASNFVLINDKGEEYICPKKDCYFVVDEKSNKTRFELKDVPAGNYIKLRFGMGLDEEMNEKGKGNINNLGDLLLETEDHDAMWQWQGNPMIMMLEGRFKSPEEKEFKRFLLHVGNHADIFHYEIVTLDAKKKIEVRDDKKSSVRIKADIAKMISGIDAEHKINLSDHPYITVNPKEGTMLYENVLSIFEIE
ncbi:hypothetical protein KRX57_03880 [Weeksellaceae bacterium TAE3-ERU29]|nr:hypothetical protein [Weeksellaceae bacterium TAE3-ERU29]